MKEMLYAVRCLKSNEDKSNERQINEDKSNEDIFI